MNTYAVFKHGKRSFRRTFETYDAARCAVRKWIRTTNFFYSPELDKYSNPNLNFFGYSIRKI